MHFIIKKGAFCKLYTIKMQEHNFIVFQQNMNMQKQIIHGITALINR